MTPGERQKIVKVLAGEDHDWTQMSIAKALGVSQASIAADIEALRGDPVSYQHLISPASGRAVRASVATLTDR